ncbi:hypothetical protein LTR86_010807 [Recurvomyces mirabilis]|nr:hypothetical protein LTR86_010807 [Recurvomyces mirabilis]
MTANTPTTTSRFTVQDRDRSRKIVYCCIKCKRLILATNKDVCERKDLVKILKEDGITFTIMVCVNCDIEDTAGAASPANPDRVIFRINRMLGRSKIEALESYTKLRWFILNINFSTRASGITARTMHNTLTDIIARGLVLNEITFEDADEGDNEPFHLIVHPFVDLDMILSPY